MKQIQSESKMILLVLSVTASRASTRGLAPPSDFGELSRAAAVPVPLLLSWAPSIKGISICRDCGFLDIPVYSYGRTNRLP